MMKQTIQALHQAAQYLAAANISFKTPIADDSHTNLGWDEIAERLVTYPFGPRAIQLGLNYQTGQLEWLENQTVMDTLSLRASTHGHTLKWLRSKVKGSDLKENYTYNFHYELPYSGLTEEDVLDLDLGAVKTVAQNLTRAKIVFNQVLEKHQLKASIRVWPHHFDLGIYAAIDLDKGLFLGGGLAIPDDLEEGLYYYATGWLSGQAVDTSTFPVLMNGRWHKDWNGATWRAGDQTISDLVKFYNQTIQAFQTIKF